MDDNQAAFSTIDGYIAAFPPDIQTKLQLMRETIREAAPEAKEKISYAMPTFDLYGNLVHFAAFKRHIGFYPGAAGVAAFQTELSAYKNSKGAVQFPFEHPIPVELVAEIVKFRVAQNTEKAAGKPKKR